MLSQDHKMSFLVFWLSTWSFNNKIPDEIHSNQSAALFAACVKVFTNYNSTNAYISGCMDSLLNDTRSPPIFLRIDRYHFVCTIHRIKLFQKMNPLKVSLFKAIFGALILCDDLSVVNKIITGLYIIMRSRYNQNLWKITAKSASCLWKTRNIGWRRRIWWKQWIKNSYRLELWWVFIYFCVFWINSMLISFQMGDWNHRFTWSWNWKRQLPFS